MFARASVPVSAGADFVVEGAVDLHKRNSPSFVSYVERERERERS